MRTEREMFDLILRYAREDDRIRAVLLNGSRVNPNIPFDLFQDYDVACFVADLAPFIHDLSIIDYFGEKIIYQLPDEIGALSAVQEKPDRYAYLMQFTDGNRIDLTFRSLADLEFALKEDSLSKLLLDKDHRVLHPPVPAELGNLPTPPAQKDFDHCCNEFWWLMPYVAKGLWRGEVINPWYFHHLMGSELLKMLNWYHGVQTDFSKSPGKLGRFFQNELDHDLWGMTKEVFSCLDTGNLWKNIYTMGELFRYTAQDVARHFGFSYPQQDDARVTEFVRLIQTLPQDASSFDP